MVGAESSQQARHWLPLVLYVFDGCYTLPIAHCRLQMADSILTGPEHVAVCILPHLTHGWAGLDWTLACGRACL
jgi:hypothetical protein